MANAYFCLVIIVIALFYTTFGLDCGIRYSKKSSRSKRSTKNEGIIPNLARKAFEPGVSGTTKNPKNTDGRIVGGKPARGGDFPWLVSIQRDGSHFCGGSIINPNWILSASHCFKDHETETEGLTVVAGASDNYANGDTYTVKEIITNDKFKFSHYSSDISLLQLTSPIEYKPKEGVGAVAPICLPEKNTDFEGTATVAGWGFLSNGGGVASKQLMAVDVKLLDSENCVTAYNIFNEQTMVCAGFIEGKQDACQGDSGGPLVAMLKNRAVQIGIVSYGEGCALRGKPGVYTRLTEFLGWIDEQINQRSE